MLDLKKLINLEIVVSSVMAIDDEPITYGRGRLEITGFDTKKGHQVCDDAVNYQIGNLVKVDNFKSTFEKLKINIPKDNVALNRAIRKIRTGDYDGWIEMDV